MMSQLHRVAAAAAAACGLTFVGCGGSSDGDSAAKGDSTTAAAIVAALDRTGYDVRYRAVASVEGYETVAGRATKGAATVDFFVVLNKTGRYRGGTWSGKEGSPQPPVVRYMETQPTLVGNLLYAVEPQSPYRRAKVRNFGWTYAPVKSEAEMTIKIGLAIEDLFAADVVGDG